MARFSIFLLVISFLSYSSCLLEKTLVSFGGEMGAILIHDATTVYAEDDPIGIGIAIETLASDLE